MGRWGRQVAVLAVAGLLPAGFLPAGAAPLPVPVPVPGVGEAEPAPAYRADTLRWRSAQGGLEGWPRASVDLAPDGALALNPYRAAGEFDRHPGSYHGRNFHNGAHFVTGEAMSPLTEVRFPLAEAVVSWDAETPPGSWLEVQVRVRMGRTMTKFFSVGVWAANDSTVERHSVDGQGDDDGDVTVDTLVLREGVTADAVQLRILFHTTRPDRVPRLRNAAVALSSARPGAGSPAAPGQEGEPGRWGTNLAVPECRVPEGGDPDQGWSHPAATAMLLQFWGRRTECAVEAIAADVGDWVGSGYDHRAFNTAVAAPAGLEGYVTRLTALASTEPWLEAGVPLVLSSTPGAVVLVGFDSQGDPTVLDPAAPPGSPALRVLPRAELERAWLASSGGTVSVFVPAERATPGRSAGGA